MREEKEKNVNYNTEHDLLIFSVFFNKPGHKHEKPSALTMILITPLLQAFLCVCVMEAEVGCIKAEAARVIRAACLCSAVMSLCLSASVLQ